MALSAQDIQNIIQQVTRQLLGEQQNNEGTLAVFSPNVFDPKSVHAYFTDKEVTCALPDGMEQPVQGCRTLRLGADRHRILSALTQYDDIVLVTPPLSLMGAIANGDDSTFAAALVIRPLLWGKTVTVLLDFETPRHLRGTALGTVAEHIDALEKMGVGIKTLPRRNKQAQAKELVTEQDIKHACKTGDMRIKIASGAIVTQLAQDTAKECGVSIEY